MSDSVRLHRRQPARLPCPWDSPGRDTGMSCHFLLQCMKVKSESEVSQLCPTLSDPMDCSTPGSSVHGSFSALVSQLCTTLCNLMDLSLPGSSVQGDSPGKNIGVCCHPSSGGVFPTQDLPHCRKIIYHLSHQRSPRILEWAASPFSRGSSGPRN